MSFKSEKLIIWQKSMEFGEEIFQENYDKCFNLMNQIIEFRNQ